MTAVHLFATSQSSRGLAGVTRLAAVGALIVGVGSAGCVSAHPFNPAGLDHAQLRWVGGICQSQLGLSPDEQPIYGPGNADLDTNTENHYEGCIASLSRSLRDNNAAYASASADEACRARGLPTGSPALAGCVLDSQRAGSPHDGMPPAEFTRVSHTVKPGSYYWMPSTHQRGREEDACAALGLSPVGGAFNACVKSLSDTFYSIDNPIN